MDISRKTDYSLRMLSELVKSDGGIVSVRTAAEKNGIPHSFARSIQHDLVRAGIVESMRGSHGGMRLAVVAPVREINLRWHRLVNGVIFITMLVMVVLYQSLLLPILKM